MNLCKNAIEAMSSDSELQIGLYWKDLTGINDSIRSGGEKFVVFEVVNEGTTIAIETCARIFDPFFTTRKNEGGHGLGLAIVKKIVEAHHGTISVSSESGQTKFIVKLPAIAD